MSFIKQMLGLEGASQTGTKQSTKNTTETATQNGSQSSTSTNQLSPAIAQLLGMNGGGVLGGLTGSLGQQNLLSSVGKDFLNTKSESILDNGYKVANSLMTNQYDLPAIGAAQIAAPSQNGINLSPTYQSMLGGGDTSTLMNSLQAGNNLTNAQFQQNTGDVTDSLMKNVLPSIRSNSVLAGQYGGSRQGVAEGNAISDYTKQLTNGATQVGLANSANNASQIANDYQMGQNRALSAAQGLSGQQYSTAATDAAARQAADNTNVNSLLNTRGLNSANQIAGLGLQQNLIGNANNYANADLSRLGMTSGILAPFLGAGATTANNGTTNSTMNGVTNMIGTDPIYENNGQNFLGQVSKIAGMFGGGQ